MKVNKIIILFVLAAFLPGCASIVGQSVFPVTINSSPSGANIVIREENGKDVFSGTTPTTVTLRAGRSYFHAMKYRVIFSKPGYEERSFTVRAELSGWYLGNIIFGGLIGMIIVDPITGKMWKLPPDVYANLSPQSALNAGQPTLQLVTLEQVPEKFRSKLVQIK